MSEDKITIEIPTEVARGFAALAGGDRASVHVSDACRTALAKHKVDQRAERLGLPLRKIAINAVQDAQGKCIGFGDLDYVCLDKAKAQRDLFFAAPEMAELLEQALTTTQGFPTNDEIRTVLVKAGWIDG
jgi:hypothetical protein